MSRSLRSSLWLVPALCVLAGVLLSMGTIALDRAFGPDLLPRAVTGGPEAAQGVLETIATSMVTLAALVLTITMVVVQLAMGQFSPRIVRSILQDTTSQLAVGLFVGTFAFAILAMREVRPADPAASDAGSVPGIAIVTAYLLVIASIILLVYYVHHLGQSLRVAALIELVGQEMRELVDRDFGPSRGTAGRGPGVILADHSGVVAFLDHDGLVEEAARAGCTIELLPAVGDFVPAGSPLLAVTPPGAPLDAARARGRVLLGPERALDQDLAYGIRMLVDIAERGLSEPFLDPTTAVQALDRLHDCLRQIADRPLPDGRFRDASGRVRLVVPTMTWDGYVALAFDEIRVAGRGSPQVPRRIAAAIDDLLSVAPPERRAALERQRRLLSQGDDGVALRPDRQGIGSGADALSRTTA